MNKPDCLETVYPSQPWHRDVSTLDGISRVFGIMAIDRSGLVIPRYDKTLLTLGSDDQNQLVGWVHRIGQKLDTSCRVLSAQRVVGIVNDKPRMSIDFELMGLVWRDEKLEGVSELVWLPAGIGYVWSENSGATRLLSMATLVVHEAGLMEIYRFPFDQHEAEGAIHTFI